MLAGIYLFTGEDIASAFREKRKIDHSRKLNQQHHLEAFKYKTKSKNEERNSLTYKILFCTKLGTEWEVSDQLCKDLESFTCLMYGGNKTESLNFLQSKMIKKWSETIDRIQKLIWLDFHHASVISFFTYMELIFALPFINELMNQS